MEANTLVALLLEDEPLIAVDLELAFSSEGFDVTTILSCEEAMEWLEVCRPDIVVVDVMLRDGPSDKVVQILIEEAIPFIVHSGDQPDMHVGTPFANGRWVSKPAEHGALINAAREMAHWRTGLECCSGSRRFQK